MTTSAHTPNLRIPFCTGRTPGRPVYRIRIFIEQRTRRGGRPRPPVPVSLRAVNHRRRGRLSWRPANSMAAKPQPFEWGVWGIRRCVGPAGCPARTGCDVRNAADSVRAFPRGSPHRGRGPCVVVLRGSPEGGKYESPPLVAFSLLLLFSLWRPKERKANHRPPVRRTPYTPHRGEAFRSISASAGTAPPPRRRPAWPKRPCRPRRWCPPGCGWTSCRWRRRPPTPAPAGS